MKHTCNRGCKACIAENDIIGYAEFKKRTILFSLIAAPFSYLFAWWMLISNYCGGDIIGNIADTPMLWDTRRQTYENRKNSYIKSRTKGDEK